MASVYDFNEETEEEEERHLDAGPRWFSTDGILVYLCSLASKDQEVIDHRVDFKKSSYKTGVQVSQSYPVSFILRLTVHLEECSLLQWPAL